MSFHIGDTTMEALRAYQRGTTLDIFLSYLLGIATGLSAALIAIALVTGK